MVVATIRILGADDPPDGFAIVEAAFHTGGPLRAPVSDTLTPDAQPSAAEVRIVNGNGATLYSQPFGWSRVGTIPPAVPGGPPDGIPNEIRIEQPEVTLILPAVATAARVEVYRAGSLTPAASRDIGTAAAAAAVRLLVAQPEPVAAVPGAFHVLVLASGFSPSRIGMVPSIAEQVRQQLTRSEPFRSSASKLAFHVADAGNLGCVPGCNGVDRQMCCDMSSVILAGLGSGVPFDEILVIHDTPVYAGSGRRDSGNYRTNSYTSYATAYHGQWTVPMLVHEFGHSFGDLCDEYTYTTEPISFTACANCRPSCSELAPFGPVCSQGCSAAPAFFRPEPSVMLDLTIPTFNNASINMVAPVEGLASRLSYFLGGSSTSVPSAPVSLQSQVSNGVVTLSWLPGGGGGAVSFYILEVGSVIGQSNVFNQPIGNVTSVSGSVGPGEYFWRLRASNAAGTSGASSEAQFSLGGVAPCSAAPAAPAAFDSQVSENIVTLTWQAPVGPVASYIVEAGSAPGLSNLYNAPTGSATPGLQTPAPSGMYYVRIRAQNGCGIGPPSAERVVIVP